MARQIRIEYAGAVYHVMARGNHGRPIFADDLDRNAWLNTLGQASGWEWERNRACPEQCGRYRWGGKVEL